VAERKDLELYQNAVRNASSCGEDFVDDEVARDRERVNVYVSYVQSVKELAGELGVPATLGTMQKSGSGGGNVSWNSINSAAPPVKFNYEKWVASSIGLGATAGNRKVTGDYSYSNML